MKADPLEGDRCLMFQKDFEESNLEVNDEQVRQMDNQPYTLLIKKVCVTHHSFNSRRNKQTIRKEVYWNMKITKPQQYLTTNKLTNQQVGLLFNLQCQSVWGIRDNFHNLYQDRMCQLCLTKLDT